MRNDPTANFSTTHGFTEPKPPQELSPGSVSSEMNRLNDANCLLRNELNDLEEALSLVMLPEMRSDGSATTAPEPMRSEVARRIREDADAVTAQAERVRQMRKRLALI